MHSLNKMTLRPNASLHRVKVFLVIGSLDWELILKSTGIKETLDFLVIMKRLLILVRHFIKIMNLSITSNFTYKFTIIFFFWLVRLFLVVDNNIHLLDLTVLRINLF